MYSTCLFCQAPLGANDAVEHFPVGRRLAFDAAKGRLWVVCRRCARWNLSPLQERWEAIEECERLFRGQRLRAQTEHVGLARLSEGLELVRVGAPLRPEFAAWRYGDQFWRRRRRLLGWAAGGVAGAAGALGAATAALGPEAVGALGASGVFVAFLGVHLGVPAVRAYRDYLREMLVPRGGGRGGAWHVYGAGLRETELRPATGSADGWALALRHVAGVELLTGDPARRALAIVMARVNGVGAARRHVREAAESIARAGGPESLLTAAAGESVRRAGNYWERRRAFARGVFTAGEATPRGGYASPLDRGALTMLPVPLRLAVEMSVNEDAERRALEGELAPLVEAWREAEEVAAIADGLLLPPEVEARVALLRESGAAGAAPGRTGRNGRARGR